MTADLTTAYRPADTAVELSGHTVGSLLAARAERYADRIALIGTERRLTYAELYAEARRTAVRLSEIANIGDYVAIWAPNAIEWPIVEYGVALAGMVLVTVNPTFGVSELAYVLRHSNAKILLHADASGDFDMAAVAAEMPGIAHVISLSKRSGWQAPSADGFPHPAIDPEAPAMLQYTSGTTGDPKGVLLSHRSLVNVAKMTMVTAEIPEGAVCVGPLPMFHTAGCVISVLGPAWQAGTLVLIERFAPQMVLDVAAREQADVLFVVPALLAALVEALQGKEGSAPQIPSILGGSARVPPMLIEAARRVFGGSVHNLYGQTELAPVLTMTRTSDAMQDQHETVGRPIPQVECKIVRRDNSTAAPGEQGEICARGYQQMIEYKDDPDATARVVDEDCWLHTGDLGVMDNRGYITLTGRLKDLIITGGENVAPAEIELRLVEHDSVVMASVIGLPDLRWGEAVTAVVVVRGEPLDDLVGQLSAHLSTRIAPFKMPKRWFVTAELPMTTTGKVQKFKLREAIDVGNLTEIG